MSNTAQVVNLEEHRPVVKADIENGYDRLAHELTNALAVNEPKLSGCEFQVVHAIISKTYRYHKKTDWIASTQLSEITGMSKAHTSKTLKSLLLKKVIVKNGKNIGVNTTVSEWKKIASCKKQKLTNQATKVNRLDNSKKLTNQSAKVNQSVKAVNQSVNKSCPIRPPQKKTTITKEIYTKERPREKTIALPELPDFIPESSLLEFLEHRKQMKKPMTELAVKKFIAKLTREHAQGFDIELAIDEAIANGHQTTYPKNFHQNKRTARAENFAGRDYGEADVRF
ncbi:replication protein [Glaciecola siphonariae]|uniref:Replication protein n=1 Tax=Glaciecola siphonariae TaxID=521012 RepID=A0ABV9LT81_9ALTE